MPDFSSLKITDPRVYEAAALAGHVMLVLLAFYLYLLVRWQYVKRPICFLLGAAGLAFAIFGQFFSLGSPTVFIWTIFMIIGNIVALFGAISTCFSGKLPIVDDTKLGSPGEPPKPQ